MQPAHACAVNLAHVQCGGGALGIYIVAVHVLNYTYSQTTPTKNYDHARFYKLKRTGFTFDDFK